MQSCAARLKGFSRPPRCAIKAVVPRLVEAIIVRQFASYDRLLKKGVYGGHMAALTKRFD